MDKLVRVRRLLQRLDFLFQLPQKLEEAVQQGQYAKAIRCAYSFNTFLQIFLSHLIVLIFCISYFFFTVYFNARF